MVEEDRGLGRMELHKTRMTLCQISQEELKEPIVACKLGNLYNKEAIIGALLNKSMPEHAAHIRALKDVKLCIISWAEPENKDQAPSLAGRPQDDDTRQKMVCPVTRDDLESANHKASVIWSSGAVISSKSLKMMKMKECPVSGKPFDPEKDVIPLAPDKEELQKLRQQLPPPKKRKKEAAEAPIDEETPGEETGEKNWQKAGRVFEPMELTKDKEGAVYKKLFNKDRQGMEGTRDAFGTPIYNRGSRCV